MIQSPLQIIHRFPIKLQEEIFDFLRKDFRLVSGKEKGAILHHLLDNVELSPYREEIAKELIQLTKLSEVIPELYREYRPIVYDGSLFFLARLSQPRFKKLLMDQILLGDEVSSGERLIRLVQEMPTLQKLGQIIARNREVEREFREWLVHLENGIWGADPDALRNKIKRELKNKISYFSIKIGKRILSEASVAAAIPFAWVDPDTGDLKEGIFKVLKPYVTKHLSEELQLFHELAIYFDKNRQNYTLKDFRFLETFKDIQDAIRSEIDLTHEQTNLKKAHSFYVKDPFLKIPCLLPISTKNITSMELIKGEKITKASLSKSQKEQCAQALFRALIGHPLFSSDEYTIFHGDPHAGNIYVVKDNDNSVQVTLLDWSLIGELSKKQRTRILQLCIGIFMKDQQRIYESIAHLSEDNLSENLSLLNKVKREIHQLLANYGGGIDHFMEKTLLLLDRIALIGVKFPRDLLIFRKAIFTLKGVLHDMYPEFDMDESMIDFMNELMIQELPERWAYLFFPLMDRPDNYRSLISNADLFQLSNCLFINGLKMGLSTPAEIIEKNCDLLRPFSSSSTPLER